MNNLGISGISTAIILIVTILVAIIIAVWITGIAQSITGRPILRPSETATVVGSTLYITIYNDGSIDYVGDIRFAVSDKVGTSYTPSSFTDQTIPAGSEISLEVSLGATPPADVSVLYGVVITDVGELPFKALVLRG